MAYSKKLDLVFIHIPKNAGTSIIEAMIEKDNTVKHGHYNWRLYSGSNPKYSFSIVRNPWDRVYSCYRYAKMEKSFWHGKGSKWGTHPDYKICNQFNFKDIIKMLYNNRALLDLPEDKRPLFHYNWSYQYNFIYNGNRVETKNIFRYENMSKVEKYLEDNFQINLPKLNVSRGKNNYTEQYDDEMIDLVSKIYSKDIELFDYTF